MGRYPFLTAADAYLESIRPYLAGITLEVRGRAFRRMARTFEDLRLGGEIGTSNPARFSEREIGAFVAHLREKNLGPTYQAKQVEFLAGLLAHAGNPILERMKMNRAVRLPKRVEPVIHVKDDAWFADAMARLATVSGWWGEAILFATAFHYHTGLRVKELRLARLADLDLKAWTFAVSHPKGEGAWAVAGEKVPIFSSVRPAVLDYLDARERRLRTLELDPARVEPLIPNADGRTYSEAFWRQVRLRVFREAGLDRTSFRVLRPSFAQKLKDHGAPIEAVSRALRHSSTATTEKFYARIRSRAAWDVLERAWDAPLNRRF